MPCVLILQSTFSKKYSSTYYVPSIVLGMPQWELQTQTLPSQSSEPNAVPRTWFMLMNITHKLKKNLYSAVVGWNILWSQRWSWCIVQVDYIFTVFSDFWSPDYWRGVGVKSPTLIKDLPILPPVIHQNYHLSAPISLCLQQLLCSRLSRSQWLSGFVCLYRCQGGNSSCKFSLPVSQEESSIFRLSASCCYCNDKTDDFQALCIHWSWNQTSQPVHDALF